MSYNINLENNEFFHPYIHFMVYVKNHIGMDAKIFHREKHYRLERKESVCCR